MENFLKKLFTPFDELSDVVLIDKKIPRENRVGQATCRFRDESTMVRDALKVRLDLGAKGVRLFSKFEMVVEDLAFLFVGEIVNVDHNLTFLQQWKRALL